MTKGQAVRPRSLDDGRTIDVITHGTGAQAAPHGQQTYAFGEFELDLHALELRRKGRPAALSRKSMRVLAYLLRRAGRVVSREEMFGALWPATRVATGSLTQAIWEIRQVLSQQPGGARMITTVRGRGYRLAVPVTTRDRARGSDAASADSASADAMWPEPLRERLQTLSHETRSIVLELAVLLARSAGER